MSFTIHGGFSDAPCIISIIDYKRRIYRFRFSCFKFYVKRLLRGVYYSYIYLLFLLDSERNEYALQFYKNVFFFFFVFHNSEIVVCIVSGKTRLPPPGGTLFEKKKPLYLVITDSFTKKLKKKK